MDSARFTRKRTGLRRPARHRGGIASMVLAVALVGAGCGATQPIESGTAAPTSTSSSSSASSSPAVSHAPAASPKPAPETAAIAAFVKLVTKGTLDYQATFGGRSRHTTARL